MPGSSASDKDTDPWTTANPSSLCRFRAGLRETSWGLYFTSVLQSTKVSRRVSRLNGSPSWCWPNPFLSSATSQMQLGALGNVDGANWWTWTTDLPIISRMFWPAELNSQIEGCSMTVFHRFPQTTVRFPTNLKSCCRCIQTYTLLLFAYLHNVLPSQDLWSPLLLMDLRTFYFVRNMVFLHFLYRNFYQKEKSRCKEMDSFSMSLQLHTFLLTCQSWRVVGKELEENVLIFFVRAEQLQILSIGFQQFSNGNVTG